MSRSWKVNFDDDHDLMRQIVEVAAECGFDGANWKALGRRLSKHGLQKPPGKTISWSQYVWNYHVNMLRDKGVQDRYELTEDRLRQIIREELNATPRAKAVGSNGSNPTREDGNREPVDLPEGWKLMRDRRGYYTARYRRNGRSESVYVGRDPHQAAAKIREKGF